MLKKVEHLFSGVYTNRKVFITGHTGFKGSWLVHWLRMMGAQVRGFSLAPDTTPSHHQLLNPAGVDGEIGDIQTLNPLQQQLQKSSPEIVFHLAAQPLVRTSYEAPLRTYMTNVMGTLHVLQAVRSTPSVKAVVVVTTDKVYDNREWEWGYREIDPLGGYDPYSSSKACADIATASFRNSFFNPKKYNATHRVLCSTVRGGNVIGGGDWSKDRLIPDLAKAANANTTVSIRSAHATRPWQHVLDCLSGYLLAGQHLLQGNVDTPPALNFGPYDTDARSVIDVVKQFSKHWPALQYQCHTDASAPHEAGYLKLDCSRALINLQWKPVWDSDKAIGKTALWYRYYYESGGLQTSQDLAAYIADAQKAEVIWTR